MNSILASLITLVEAINRQCCFWMSKKKNAVFSACSILSTSKMHEQGVEKHH